MMIRIQTVLLLLVMGIFTSACHDTLFDSELSNSSRITFDIEEISHIPLTRGTPQVGMTAYEKAKINVLGYVAVSNPTPAESYSFTATLSKSGSAWGYNPAKSWDGKTFNFYAYASDGDPVDTTPNDNGLSISAVEGSDAAPTLTYTAPTTVDLQPDLLIASPEKAQTSGKITMTMHHTLSCIGFVATSQTAGRRVRSITLKKVYATGEISLAADPTLQTSWKNLSNSTITFTAGTNSEELDKDIPPSTTNPAPKDLTYIMQGNGYLMMIPQELPDGAQIVVEIEDIKTPGLVNTFTYDIPPTTWQPGKKYMYYFDEIEPSGIVTYYEKYNDGSTKCYYYDGPDENNLTLYDGIISADLNPTIVDAGYGLLVPAAVYARLGDKLQVKLGLGTHTQREAKTDGSVVTILTLLGNIDCVLYGLSQDLYPYNHTAAVDQGGFQPANTNTPVTINAGTSVGNTFFRIYGYCIPHYSRGVYKDATPPTNHFIRTPIQMRNISYQTNASPGSSNHTGGKIFVQEFATMNYTATAGSSIRGKDKGNATDFDESIVQGHFLGIFDGKNKYNFNATTNTPEVIAVNGRKATLNNLKINRTATDSYSFTSRCIAMFEEIGLVTNPTTTYGIIRNVAFAGTCSFTSSMLQSASADAFTAACAGYNYGEIDGVDNAAAVTTTGGSSTFDRYLYAGGIVAFNVAKVANCTNSGTITNGGSSGSPNPNSNRTGGIAAMSQNTKAWSSLSIDQQNSFAELERKDWEQHSNKDAYIGTKILNCTNSGVVNGYGRVGGIVATNNYGGIVYKCSNSAAVQLNTSVSMTGYAGGIVAMNQAGELVSASLSPKFFSTISNCINSGAIGPTTTHNRNNVIGGIVGINDFNGVKNINTAPSCWGRVYRCANTMGGNVLNRGLAGGTASRTLGGIVGTNNGGISQCECVNITVTDGSADTHMLAGMGGIAGINTNYVGDCLFVSTSSTSPIIQRTTNAQTKVGGIVGYNDIHDDSYKSNSGYITRCVYLAHAPQVPSSLISGSQIFGLAPITMYSQYLYRNENGSTNLGGDVNVDAISGASPLYTVQQCFYISDGTTINPMTTGIYEPVLDVVKKPFMAGRYHNGCYPTLTSQFGFVPFLNDPVWGSWSRSTYPYITFSSERTGIAATGSGDYNVQATIANWLHITVTNGSTFNYPTVTLKNTFRIPLTYINSTRLNGMSTGATFTLNFTNVTFSNSTTTGAHAYGGLVIKAPDGWKITSSTPSPTGSYNSTPVDNTQYVYLSPTTEKIVTFTKQ